MIPEKWKQYIVEEKDEKTFRLSHVVNTTKTPPDVLKGMQELDRNFFRCNETHFFKFVD
jgi:hypothetical protein